jgi:restriction endonuclease S subunit
LNKYFFYWLNKNVSTFINLGIGSTFTEISSSTIKKINAYFPVKSIQKQIIDIIEPIEKTISVCKKINDVLEKMVFKRSFCNKTINQIVDWKSTGYSYTDYDKKNNGQYKILTIKNIQTSKKTDFTNLIMFNKLDIGDVITGLSGTFGTASIIVDTKCVSNQRTLSLRSRLPLIIKTSIVKQKKFLSNNSTGGVQKNITPNNILNLRCINHYEWDIDINIFFVRNLEHIKKLSILKTQLINLLIK